MSPDQLDAVLRCFDLSAYADNPAWSSCYGMERLPPDFTERTKAQNRGSRSALRAGFEAVRAIADFTLVRRAR